MSIETDRAWMAGIIDGEGTIIIGKDGYHYQSKVSVCNTNTDTFTLFMEEYSGIITPYRKGINCKVLYVWCCPAANQQRIITDVIPYLKLKLNQANIMLEYLRGLLVLGRFSTHNENSGEILKFRDESYRKLKEINHGGYY